MFVEIFKEYLSLSDQKFDKRICLIEKHWFGLLFCIVLVLFDRSSFKMFSLKFLNKMVQAPSCERPKTTQRTLFLLFANNNCFPITLYSVGLRHTFYTIYLMKRRYCTSSPLFEMTVNIGSPY